jgi:hypothetical protein
MDDMYNKMRRTSHARVGELAEQADRRAEKSKQRLINILDKKFKTTFIGAISSIEAEFGFLWGQDKAPGDRTRTEQEWYERWQRARTNILNNGNNQFRAIQNELQQYMVDWQGYKMQLHCKE